MAVVVAGGMAGVVAPAQAQDRFSATVTAVVDGDAVDAQVAGGPALRVRLIGIDTPERGECGTAQATGYMEQLVLERNVTLVSDPTQDALDSFGRSVFCIDRDDGLDLGEECCGGAGRPSTSSMTAISSDHCATTPLRMRRSKATLASGGDAKNFHLLERMS
jgi:hypothetical protein